LLFKPSLGRFKVEGIHQILFNSITKCDIDIRKELYASLVLSGGTTMFIRLPERLEKETIGLAPARTKVKVIPPPDRKYGAWRGGSPLSSLETFPKMFVTREECIENGFWLSHHRFFETTFEKKSGVTEERWKVCF
jgi:actin-related protein